MPLQATSGAASYDAFGGGVPIIPQYIEEVFSTWLYAGNGSTQTITNGIDLAGKGGLVWLKSRNTANIHGVFDTARGVSNYLIPNTTDAQGTVSGVSSFNANGFTLGSAWNESGRNLASWTFRKQPKFFDVVTWTGNGANRTIAHNLGSVPGMIIVKRTDASADWRVYHRSNANTGYMTLNSNSDLVTDSTVWNSTTPTSTVFSVGTSTTVNASGGTYVAYLFAHNAGGFGLAGTDNVITCGTYTGDGSATGPIVTLGYEPQWLLFKRADSPADWYIVDNMRGLSVTQLSTRELIPNNSKAENADYASTGFPVAPLSTGFQLSTSVNGSVNASGAKYIYIAIRRGPMKVPTTGTSVYKSNTRTGNGTEPTITGVGFVPDLIIPKHRQTGSFGNSTGHLFTDRLRGNNNWLFAPFTDGETGAGGNMFTSASGTYNIGWSRMYESGIGYVDHVFRRAPGFFDVVCYTGNGTAGNTVNHNLTVAPELIITKRRDSASTSGWPVGCIYYKLVSDFDRISFLNLTNGFTGGGAGASYNNVGASSYTLSVTSDLNASGGTFVAYLFASCPGVSKVGSFTGNGSSQTINCGFTGGARFVMIKRADSSGDWYVWDTARGIVAGNDPHLSLNTTAAEVTSNDTIDTDSTGFVVNQVAATNVNVNAATYIFLAVS